jgi:hypothetical protein
MPNAAHISGDDSGAFPPPPGAESDPSQDSNRPVKREAAVGGADGGTAGIACGATGDGVLVTAIAGMAIEFCCFTREAGNKSILFTDSDSDSDSGPAMGDDARPSIMPDVDSARRAAPLDSARRAAPLDSAFLGRPAPLPDWELVAPSEPVSAFAMDAVDMIAEPIPSATAKAPTRPM